MKRQDLKIIGLALTSAFALSGCNLFPGSSSNESSIPVTSKGQTSEASSAFSSSSEEEPEESDTNPIAKTKFQYNYKDYSDHCYLNNDVTPSIGNPKLLVIPIWFTDSTHCIHENHKEDVRQDIETAYFGTEGESGWQSVKTYYHTLSQGRCNIDGVVAPWYEIGESMSAYGNDQNATKNLVKTAADWYFAQQNSLPRSYFDTDNDGHLDGVMLIYAAPDYASAYNDWDSNNDGRENFWAYTSWTLDDANLETPTPNAYFWASYDFMYDTSTANVRTGLYFYGVGDATNCNVDAHAFIHEMGHMFGLVDYYDYSGQYSPAGGFSMQDSNVGSHDPYSALALGWADPYVPEDSCTLTIKPFQNKGHDLVLLQPNGFNVDKSPFDEYVLLELYTPTGLNQFDCEYTYREYTGQRQGPSEVGIRIWHVDSRLVKINERYGRITVDATHPKKVPDVDDLYLMMTNTYWSSREDMSGRLSVCGSGYYNYNILQLIRNDTTATYQCSDTFAGEDLFGNGSQFTCSKYNGQFVNGKKLNSGDTLGWTVNVTITGEGKDARATLQLFRD
ncbi:MAG: immune inhibitor A [Bacilli bacterium]|nr:immune inhibitor A [Bacilli bacterium]